MKASEKTKFVEIGIVFSAFLYLFLPPGLASIGVAIAPATGFYNFSLGGGEIEFTVYNTGDEDALYLLTIEGNAKNFTYIQPEQAIIKAGSYATFKAIVNPDEKVELNKPYTLIVLAKVASPGMVSVSAKSEVNLFFYKEVKYEEMKKLEVWLYIAFIIVIVCICVIYKLYKS